MTKSKLADNDERLVKWYAEKGLSKKEYYLVVGRFVPENSFEIMIREFMKSNSKRDFAIITISEYFTIVFSEIFQYLRIGALHFARIHSCPSGFKYTFPPSL